jgi:hypothetical protein
VRDNEEENVRTEDDSLPQEEETDSQRCITEDVSQKRKYICCAVLCSVLCYLRTIVDARLVTFNQRLFRLGLLYVLKRTL